MQKHIRLQNGINNYNLFPGDNKLGDFTDNSTGDDYGYDVNGNMITDKNKRIDGSTGIDIAGANGSILYNHLNLPWKITVKDSSGNPKGTITYIYDALGNKLRKLVNDTAAHLITSTDYAGPFVYQNDTLQFFGMEEGRIRTRKINNADTVYYDYFVKDHLGNIRMVLTDQQQLDQYPALSFEDQTSPVEQLFYENAASAITSRPGAFFDNSSNGDKVQLLRKSTQSMGAGKLLKVMATDKLHIKVDYYVADETTNNVPAAGTLSIIEALPGLINSNPATVALHGEGDNISEYLSYYVPFLSFLSPTVGSGGTMPKAFLNVLFFDEHFKFIEQNSELIQVTTKGSGQHIYRVTNDAKIAPGNGYAWIFVSNESNNLVYFDNLQVTHERGPLVEENHYYPWGLRMAGVSSKSLAFGGAENQRKFNQGTELNTDFNINLYETKFRGLDPQIGRFWQIDPLAEMHPNLTFYAYVGNNPLRYNDPFGLDTVPTTINNGTMNVPKDAAQGDVLQIDNGNGSLSYYTYDPDNAAANSQGYVGSGMQKTEEGVTVSATAKSSPASLPIWFDAFAGGAEYRLGVTLDKYRLDGYGRGRPLFPGPAQRVFDRNFPKGSFENVRPVNVHIPGTGSSIQAPRYVVSATGQILKFVGIASSIYGAYSTEQQYANGEISNAHRWSNHLMTVVSYIGPGGMVVSLLYTAVFEDAIFGEPSGYTPSYQNGYGPLKLTCPVF